MPWLDCQVRALSFPREEVLQHHSVGAASLSEGGSSLSPAVSVLMDSVLLNSVPSSALTTPASAVLSLNSLAGKTRDKQSPAGLTVRERGWLEGTGQRKVSFWQVGRGLCSVIDFIAEGTAPERTCSGALLVGQVAALHWTSCASLPTHPEDVVDEEPTQQDAASADVVQVQEFYPVKGEGQAEEVVGNPVLGEGESEATLSLQRSTTPLQLPGPWLLTFLSRYQTPTMLLRPRHTRSLVSNS